MVLRQRSGQVHRPGPAGKEGTRELRWGNQSFKF